MKTFTEKLQEQAEELKKKREQEKVHCTECDTVVWKDTIDDAVETAESHDESRHDGEPTTKVNGIVPPTFTDDEKEQIQNAVNAVQNADEA